MRALLVVALLVAVNAFAAAPALASGAAIDPALPRWCVTVLEQPVPCGSVVDAVVEALTTLVPF